MWRAAAAAAVGAAMRAATLLLSAHHPVDPSTMLTLFSYTLSQMASRLLSTGRGAATIAPCPLARPRRTQQQQHGQGDATESAIALKRRISGAPPAWRRRSMPVPTCTTCGGAMPSQPPPRNSIMRVAGKKIVRRMDGACSQHKCTGAPGQRCRRTARSSARRLSSASSLQVLVQWCIYLHLQSS